MKKLTEMSIEELADYWLKWNKRSYNKEARRRMKRATRMIIKRYHEKGII